MRAQLRPKVEIPMPDFRSASSTCRTIYVMVVVWQSFSLRIRLPLDRVAPGIVVEGQRADQLGLSSLL